MADCFTDVAPGRTDGRAEIGPATVLGWAAWSGLVVGGAGLLTFLAQSHWVDPRNYNMSRHFPWMFLASGLITQGIPGVLLAALAWLKGGRIGVRAAAAVLAFPFYLDLLFRWPVMTVACLLLASGLAVRTGSFLAARASAVDRLVKRSLAAMALAAGLVVAASLAAEAAARGSRLAGGQTPADAPNVLLLVLDTVRARSLSLYGHARATSPNLKRYAARGVRFDHAYSAAPWTAPSHAAMFTGRLPHELAVAWNRPLEASWPTLAGHLRAAGYDTAGFVANTTYCSYETGLSRGFARYEDYDVSLRETLLCSSLVRRSISFVHKRPAVARLLGEDRPARSSRKSAERINGDFLGWLDSRGASRPFFAFLNFYDAHHPYLTPEPDGCGDAPGYSDEDVRMLREWWEFDKRGLDARRVELIRESYERCVTYLDAQVGRLLDELDRRGALKNTLVIVTADHGEHLGERKLFGHGTSLYSPELHVPLLVLAPGAAGAGRVVSTPVSLCDLPATVLDVLGLPGGSPFPGRSLARAWNGTGNGDGELGPALSEIESPPDFDPNLGASPVLRGPMTSLVGWGYHYIRNGDGREELYALDDPAEEHDLAASPEAAVPLARLRSALRR